MTDNAHARSQEIALEYFRRMQSGELMADPNSPITGWSTYVSQTIPDL